MGGGVGWLVRGEYKLACQHIVTGSTREGEGASLLLPEQWVANWDKTFGNVFGSFPRCHNVFLERNRYETCLSFDQLACMKWILGRQSTLKKGVLFKIIPFISQKR